MLPEELQLLIIDFSYYKHILLHVCKRWNQYIINNPPTDNLLTAVGNDDIYTIFYHSNKTWHLSRKQFYTVEVVNKVIAVNNTRVIKEFIDIYYLQCLNMCDEHNVGTKLINHIIASANFEVYQYIKDKKYLNYSNGPAVTWNRLLSD